MSSFCIPRLHYWYHIVTLSYMHRRVYSLESVSILFLCAFRIFLYNLASFECGCPPQPIDFTSMMATRKMGRKVRKLPMASRKVVESTMDIGWGSRAYKSLKEATLNAEQECRDCQSVLTETRRSSNMRSLRQRYIYPIDVRQRNI